MLVAGIALGLYGLLLLVYRGEGEANGDTYITLRGSRIDAQLAGSIGLPVAFIAIAGGVYLLVRRRRIANPS